MCLVRYVLKHVLSDKQASTEDAGVPPVDSFAKHSLPCFDSRGEIMFQTVINEENLYRHLQNVYCMVLEPRHDFSFIFS